MSKAVLFRTSLAGYNKKDVNDYIRRHAAETQAQMEEQKQSISSLSKELASCREQAQKEQDCFKERLARETEALAEGLTRAEGAVKELLEQLAQADQQVQMGLAHAQKAEKYDQLAQGLGQLLNLELKAEETVSGSAPDRRELQEALSQSLQELSQGLSQLRSSLQTEE